MEESHAIMLEEWATEARPAPTAELTAQQTNLARVILRDDASYLNHPHERHPVTGGRGVLPLERSELVALGNVWDESPVSCIGLMNRAIGEVQTESRRLRYVDAAVDLEVVMDQHAPTEASDQSGIPSYLRDGYTDLGSWSAPTRRESIRVDKARLRGQLVSSKKLAVHELSRTDVASDLSARLRRAAQLLRDDVLFKEGEAQVRTEGGTVLLSDCVERGSMACRHMSILMQLRLQDAGVRSRLVKGVLKLYGLKTRHAWNVVRSDAAVGLIDATFAEKDVPLVIVGASLADVYERAERVNRIYRESPDSANCYTMRPGA